MCKLRSIGGFNYFCNPATELKYPQVTNTELLKNSNLLVLPPTDGHLGEGVVLMHMEILSGVQQHPKPLYSRARLLLQVISFKYLITKTWTMICPIDWLVLLSFAFF